MKANVGGFDKIARIGAGIVLIGLAGNRHGRRLGLDRRRAAGHRTDGLVPGLQHLRHEYLPDEEVKLSGFCKALLRYRIDRVRRSSRRSAANSRFRRRFFSFRQPVGDANVIVDREILGTTRRAMPSSPKAASSRMPLRLLRSILRRWAKAAATSRREPGLVAGRAIPPATGNQAHHGRIDLRRRIEGFRRHIEQPFEPEAVLQHHRHATEIARRPVRPPYARQLPSAA